MKTKQKKKKKELYSTYNRRIEFFSHLTRSIIVQSAKMRDNTYTK